MNIKTVVLVVIFSLLIGLGIYWFTMKPKAAAITSTTLREVPKSTQTIPSPSPIPSQPPIDAKTSLSTEIKTLTSPDFSEDYKKLKEEASSNF